MVSVRVLFCYAGFLIIVLTSLGKVLIGIRVLEKPTFPMSLAGLEDSEHPILLDTPGKTYTIPEYTELLLHGVVIYASLHEFSPWQPCQPPSPTTALPQTNLITPFIPVYGLCSASSLYLILVWPGFPFSRPVFCSFTKNPSWARPNSDMGSTLGFVFCGQFLCLLALLEYQVSLGTRPSPPLAQMVTVFFLSLLLPWGQEEVGSAIDSFHFQNVTFPSSPRPTALNLMLFNRTGITELLALAHSWFLEGNLIQWT